MRALLDAWLAAQNQGQFAAYERLYAPRFTGIKRSGTRQARFDRDGWLRDRKGMFEQPMKVEADGVAVSLTPDTAVLTFRQTWSSASYRDVGPKQMVVVATPDGARIAREELLSSALIAPPEAAAKSLLLLTPDGIVLDASPDDARSLGASRPGSRESIALRAVDEQRLSPALRAWKGRAVRTFAADGTTCTASVTGFALRAEVVPHFGSVQSWHGQLDTKALTPPQIAEEVWEMALQGGRALIGTLDKACDGLWALEEKHPAPLVVAPEAASRSVQAAALRSLRALPDYAKLQADFVAHQPGAHGPWDEYGEHRRDVFVFRKDKQPVLVSIFARAGNGCADFGGQLGALFSVRPGPGPLLELLVMTPMQLPSSAFDLDGDGSLEVLFGSAQESDAAWLFQRTPSGPTLDELFRVPFLDCGC